MNDQLPTKPATKPTPAVSGGQPRSEQLPYAIRLLPPGPQLLFGQLESEDALRERLRSEALSGPQPRRIEFPANFPGMAARTLPRAGPDAWMMVPPHYVCHKRLYFEQPWTERCGNTLGMIQPLVSAGVFYGDVVIFPIKVFYHPLQYFECHSDGCSPFFGPQPH
jgi:hypothetical protein